MKSLILLMVVTVSASAQDFKLFYAKNVTDVSDFSSLSAMERELSWREVVNGSIDGNLEAVRRVREMLSERRMKGLEDQRLFWRMRDEMLLCFRIEDGAGGGGSFHVELNYGKDDEGRELKRMLTTRRYFFANMPLGCDSVVISVWRVKDPSQRLVFRYWVYDWDDANVYVFQLDQKRQSTGDRYKMEYVTSHVDMDGDVVSESEVLELEGRKFQSFYVGEGETLSGVYLLTGNDDDGWVKLGMDMEALHAGIDIDHELEVPSLLPTFRLAKHENRELMNFNWLGTGLYEKYDTLYIKLFDELSKPVRRARMSVHRVDGDGRLVKDERVCYVGYDSERGCHKVLTYGHGAYVEIVVDGYVPVLYRYKGCSDGLTGMVSGDLCSARITLRRGPVDGGGIAVSEGYFRYLKDEGIAVDRITSGGDTISYAVCSIMEENISGRLGSETLAYADNGGNDFPKLYNNEPIEKFAQLEVAFSAPKGWSSAEPSLTVTELGSKKTHRAGAVETRVVSSLEFRNLTRDYYFVRYDMSEGIPYNVACKLELSTGNGTYDKFPLLMNVYKDHGKEKEEATKLAAEMTSPPDSRDHAAGATESLDLGFKIPVDMKLSLPKGISINAGSTIDFSKQVQNWYISGRYNKEQQGQSEAYRNRLRGARENAKEVANYRYTKAWEAGDGEKKKSALASFSESSFKYDDWIATEMESLFDANHKHIGSYFQGGFKLSMKMPLLYVVPNPLAFQLEEVSGNFEFGYGMFFSPDMGQGALREIKEFLDDWTFLTLDIGMKVDANLKAELGIRSFGGKKKDPYSWSSDDKGFMASITGSLSLGAWAALKLRGNPFFNIEAGLRGGGKALACGGLVVPFCDEETTLGSRFYILGGIQAYFALRSFIVNTSGNYAFRAGGHWLFPDNNHNPFHSNFPYWLPDGEKKSRAIGSTFRKLSAPAGSSLGEPLLKNVYYDANAHFMDGSRVVYNNLGEATDYNDDEVTVATLMDGKVTSMECVSERGTASGQHMRSKRGDKEIIVYQQSTTAIDNSLVNDDTAADLDARMLTHTQIKAAMLQPDGTWKHTDVTPDDGLIDQSPVVTIQEDGKAAVIYQHGIMVTRDESASVDAINSRQFDGRVLLRTYDPATGWSEPTTILFSNEDSHPVKYDLVMRNDTVLMITMLDGPNAPQYDSSAGKFTVYACKPINGELSYTYEDLHCTDFFINRVGEHAAVALLYERPDSTREIYIKTLNMDGTGDGLAGCDLGVGKAMPYKVKIVTDRSDNATDDFAVLWTEQSTIVRDAEQGNTTLKEMHTVLNATRIHLSDSPQLTYPLTVGSDRDSLLMGDFDGYLDDASLKVVYTLTDANTSASFVMYNEKEFTNSFESDVTYSREALLGSSTLPVNVYIHNTGTSAIKGATVTINGDVIEIPDVLVHPLQDQKYVVQYPIGADFDGYMQTSVEVEYANVFKARRQTGRRSAARSLLRQSRAFGSKRVVAGAIDCQVVSRSIVDGVNTFIVEVTDRSSRGLTPGSAVEVGAYVHPSAMETVSDDAKVVLRREDFTRMGGVRKAYAELTVTGVSEPVDGYIAAHIIDLECTDVKDSDAASGVRVANGSPQNSPCFVVFLPTDELTDIYAGVKDVTLAHRVTATMADGGILLGNVQPGDNIRLFSSAGWTVYMGQATGTTHFVPLKRHDVYVISASKEVFKFTY